MAGKVRKTLLYLTATAALGGAGHISWQAYQNYMLQQQKIQAQAAEMLHGALVNGYAGMLCIEGMSGQHVDVQLYYMAFGALRAENPFPTHEARAMQKHGGALLIKLEPWSGTGPDDKTYSLQDIVAGKHNGELAALARGARDARGPVFISFGQNMNLPTGETYPWAGQAPELYVKAFRRVRQEVSELTWFAESGKAPNITWVWNPYALGKGVENFDPYYPGDAYVDWVALNIYHKTGESVGDFILRLEKSVKALKKYGKPIMIGEFASNAPDKEKAAIIQAFFAKIAELELQGFVYFNAAKIQEGLLETWSLNGPKSRTAYAEALKDMEELLRRNIVTEAGKLEDDSEPLEKKPVCAEVEETYYTPAEAKEIRALKKFIAESDEFLNGFIGGDPHYNNKRRIELARAYQQLYGLTLEKDLLKRAKATLEEAMQEADPVLVYHWEEEFIRGYIEALLQFANIYAQTDALGSLDFCKKILTHLESIEKIKYLNPRQERKESVPGYYYKVLSIKARILASLGRIEEAKELYEKVAGWNQAEVEKNLLNSLPWKHPWWRGETPWYEPWNRADLQYNAASATNSLGFIYLYQNQTEKAKEYFSRVIEMERTGKIGLWSQAKNKILFWGDKDKAFLDLSFEAFIGIMRAYLQEDAETAIERFNTELPWEQIDGYNAFKKALNMQGQTLGKNSGDKWQPIIDGLSTKGLVEPLKASLSVIKMHERVTGE